MWIGLEAGEEVPVAAVAPRALPQLPRLPAALSLLQPASLRPLQPGPPAVLGTCTLVAGPVREAVWLCRFKCKRQLMPGAK